MYVKIQVVIDAAEPAKLADFWAFALDYVLEPPPYGFETWEDFGRSIGMPEEDGFALIRQLREREATEGGHLPAIALTAFASQADREEALSLGFEAHIAKPVSAHDLTRTVADLVGRSL